MKSKTKGLILGGSAILLTTLGLALPRWSGLAANASPAGTTASAAAAGAPGTSDSTAALPPRRWDAGTTYVYDVKSTRSIEMGDEDSAEPKTLVLSGRLSVSVVRPTEGGVLLRFALGSIQEDGAGAAPAALSKAFYAVAEPTGKLVSFSFQRGLAGKDRGTLKSLATSLQIVVPSLAAPAWGTLEQDVSGEYEASYRVNGGAIHKSKDRFVRARGPRGLQPIEDPSSFQVTSASDIGLDASGWPRAVSENESIAVTAGTLRLRAHSRATVKLAAIESSPDLARLAAAEEGSLEAEPEVDSAGFAQAKRRADEGLLAGAGYTGLLGDLRAESSKDRNRAMARMAALFRLRPEEAKQAAESVLRGGLDEETTQRLLGALGGAGTREAQEAMTSVLESESASPETRSSAAAEIGMTREPTEQSMQALQKAASSADKAVSDTATLGLGNLAKHMNDAQSGDPSDALAGLIQRLQGATTDEERILCLDALGNSGDLKALPAITPYLGHASVSVRAAAVSALRFMESVDDELTAALQDTAGEVRRAAAKALAYRPITPLQQPVSLLLKHDPDVSTRLALVKSLQLRKRQEPNLTELLDWARNNDPSQEVRDAASTAATP